MSRNRICMKANYLRWDVCQIMELNIQFSLNKKAPTLGNSILERVFHQIINFSVFKTYNHSSRSEVGDRRLTAEIKLKIVCKCFISDNSGVVLPSYGDSSLFGGF